jgi:hypothetical protein
MPRIPALILVGFLASCEGVVGELPLPGETSAVVSIDEFACPGPATVSVPVSCRIRAASNQAVTCVVTTGSETQRLERCEALQTFTLTRTVSGSVEVRATATAGLATAVKTLILDVNAPGNTPPTITRFAANPTRGAVPFTVPLSFAVSDAQNDPLSCAIDVGADGSDDVSANCSANMSSVLLRAPGVVRLRLVVSDGRGGRATSELDVEATPASATGGGSAGGSFAGGRPGGGAAGGSTAGGATAGGATAGGMAGGSAAGGATAGGAFGGGAATDLDLRVAAIQFGQTVITPQLKLVSSKTAFVRAWIVRTGTVSGTVPAIAEVREGGSVIETVNLTVPPTIPTVATPAVTPTEWATGFIPAARVRPGMEVVVRVDPANAHRESDEANNSLSTQPTVGRANQLNLTHVPIVQSGLTGVVPPTIAAYLLDRWPVANIDERTRAPYTFSGALTGTTSSAWSTLLSNLTQARTNDGSSRNYYGWARVSYRSGVAGIGTVGRGVSAGRDDSLDTAAHELGHNFGRNHAPCGVSGDANYPHANARIGVWGVDRQGSYKDPARLADLMSYCDPTWVSDYTYNGVQAFVEGRTPFTPGQVLTHVTGGKDALLIAGRLHQGRFTFRPVYRVRAAPTEPADDGVVLRLTFADGGQRHITAALDEVGDGEGQLLTAVVDEARPVVRLEALLAGRPAGVVELGPPAETSFSLRRDDERLTVGWTRPDLFVAATHVADDGQRTTLTLDAAGGSAALELGGLRGGQLELSTSTGLATVMQVVPVP